MMSKYKFNAAKMCSSTEIAYLCFPPNINCVSYTMKKHINPAPPTEYMVRQPVMSGRTNANWNSMKLKNTIHSTTTKQLVLVKSYFV